MIKRLRAGGIIANYRCPAACGHCMYGSSPEAEPGYINEETALRVCARLRQLGCRGLHIGGGEPFLNVDGLIALIHAITESGIAIDYIETNAAWVTKDEERNIDILRRVLKAGGDTVMVSADPFHVGFIPFWKPKTLISLLRKTGAPHFIWQERYLPLLSRLDENRTYNGNELKQQCGYDVLARAAEEYGMGFNGRALNLIRPAAKKRQAGSFIQNAPCGGLLNAGHFHADFLGRYVPPGCTGMGILVEDLGRALNAAEYPVLSRLYEGGTASLFNYALEKNYKPQADGYASQCDLCFSIRKYLSLNFSETHPDLTPGMFYRQDF